MNRSRLALARMLALALVSIALGACYGHGARSQDGQSHWLRQCLSGSACGGDEICACGVCTRLCKDDASCGADSQCTPVGEASSCSDAPTGIKQLCLASCTARTDCAGSVSSSSSSALACIDSVCMTPVAVDAGRAGGPGDAGGDVADASADAGAHDAATTPPPPVRNSPPPSFQGTPFVSLSPRLEGDLLVADIHNSGRDPLFMNTCTLQITFEKYSVELDRRIPRRDDRPPFYDNPGYYLDGVFVPPNHSLNCDAHVCTPFPSRDLIELGETYEYTKTGTMAPPPNTVGAAAQVDVIERTPLSGELTVTVSYFQESTCDVPTGYGVVYQIPVPEQGVCCPIGVAECASTGPRGGWADSLEHCRPFVPSASHAQVRLDDARGCPVLIENESSCCDCSSDADAGR